MAREEKNARDGISERLVDGVIEVTRVYADGDVRKRFITPDMATAYRGGLKMWADCHHRRESALVTARLRDKKESR